MKELHGAINVIAVSEYFHESQSWFTIRPNEANLFLREGSKHRTMTWTRQ